MIIVVGIPRSGTSLITGCLVVRGAVAGETASGDADNPKGYFENVGLRDAIETHLAEQRYFGITCDQLCLTVNEAPEEIPDISAVVEEYLGVSPQRIYKDPRMAVMWPVWHKAFPEAKWVIVRRDLSDVVASCKRASFTKNIQTDWGAWAENMKARLSTLAASTNSMEVHPDNIVEGDYSEINAVSEWCGLSLEPLTPFIIPEAWNANLDCR